VVAVGSLLGCSSVEELEATGAETERQLLKVQRVVVAPPAITFDSDTLLGTITDPEQEVMLRRQVALRATESLRSAGYDVVEYDFGEAVAADDGFAMLIAKVRENFREARRTLKSGERLSSSQRESFQATVGLAASMVADDASVDAVLLLEYLGVPDANGVMASPSALQSLMTGGASVTAADLRSDQALIEAVLLDGDTGRALWMATVDQSLQEVAPPGAAR
jgi:hypothetical protein